MKSLKKYFSLCVIILLTSCSNTVNQISAEELVAQGCADYKRAPQSPEASIKFRKAANIDEKYRVLVQSVSSIQTFLIISKSISDEQSLRALGITALNDYTTIKSFCP